MHLVAPKMSLNVPGRSLAPLHPFDPAQPLLGVHATEQSVVHLDQDHVGREVLQATPDKPPANHGLNRNCPLVDHSKPSNLPQVVATPTSLNDVHCMVHHLLTLSQNVPHLNSTEPSLQPLCSLETNASAIKFVTGNPPPDLEDSCPCQPSPHEALDHRCAHLTTPHLLETQLPRKAPEPPAPNALDLDSSPQLLFVASGVPVHALPQATASKVLLQSNNIGDLCCKILLHLQIPFPSNMTQIPLLQQCCCLIELIESFLPQFVAHHLGSHDSVQPLDLLCRELLQSVVAATV
mmetsp:Transcript_42620/g.93006  ORF Transcript_42620/g.93006 Transcript_42620/m.93006 type:complete len:293 (-) Transcript_42620:1802-2680(-)